MQFGGFIFNVNGCFQGERSLGHLTSQASEKRESQKEDSSSKRFFYKYEKKQYIVQICVILIHRDSNYQINAGPFDKNIYSKHHLFSPN